MTTLTDDAVLAVCDLLGIQTMPLVLGIGPRQDSIDAFLAAREAVTAQLRERGLVDAYDDVAAELAAALQILAAPERELAARIVTADGPRRVCLARRGAGHAFAIRAGDTIDIATTWADEDGVALARPFLAALGDCPPAEVPSFNGLAEELAARLDAASDSADYADVAYHLGVVDRGATEFGMAMAHCHARAEIVAYAHDDGRTIKSSGAVAVYDTARGRIAASPNAAPDLRVWTTFSPGSDHRIAQAISALVATLPGGRWMP
ncbi:ESX secretion-associated protein EspG [Nocardia higoensis]|uniref:ESX secretion-associated protein EspG n=1 Tax=Nocardia higoensis TaxID=228599 RepID=UPI0002DAC7AD|nr:ESX secretion-associated protein EspG [Nocardia higoensis]